MKKLFSALSILILVSILLAACAPAATPAAPIVQTVVVKETVVNQVEKTVVVNKEVTPTPVPPKVTGTVRVGSWDSDAALEPFNNAIKSFQAAYPNVKVQLESVPQGYGDKLLAQFASGTAPDVFQVGDGDVAKFASQGVLEPLDAYIKGDQGGIPLDMGVFYPAIAKIGMVGDKTYLLSKDYSPLVLYYNKKLFDEAKVEYPTDKWTWEDLMNAAAKLTKKDAAGKTTQWGIQLPDSWGDLQWTRGILPIIYQGGGNIISADGKKVTGYLDSDATLAALQWYVDIFLKAKVAPMKADVDALSGQDLFQTGKVAMLYTGRWPLKDFQKNTKLNFGTAMLPTGKQRGNSICWAGFAIYSKSQNKTAAWAFLRWIGADQGAQEFAKYALTAVKPIAQLQGLDTDPYNASVMADLANVKPLPDFTNQKFGDCVATPFQAALEQIFLKGGDLKALMKDVATKADACLAK
jgi:multiple sugar transport system substrate-binding protein